MEKLNRIFIYESDNWTIDLRPRNNMHEGEPPVKVWICKMDQEVAKYSSKYRGYGRYQDNEELIPPIISEAAKKVWAKLCENPTADIKEIEAVAGDIRKEIEEFIASNPVPDEGEGE